ncbi:uroporphyrinogen-III synthase [Francisellaceae bacterium CB299]
MNVLICRPKEDANELIDLVATKGVKALALPTIEIKDIATTIEISEFTDFIFTSKHAVKSFFAQHDAKLLADKKIYSIGTATAKELQSFGLNSQCPDKHNSKALFSLIKKASFVDKKFAIISGVGGNTYLEDEIAKYTTATKVTVYERVLVNKEILQDAYTAEYSDAEPDLIVATSIDVFKSLIRIFEEAPLPAQAKVTITSPKMLKFVLENGFNRTLELKQIDNDYISKQILVDL